MLSSVASCVLVLMYWISQRKRLSCYDPSLIPSLCHMSHGGWSTIPPGLFYSAVLCCHQYIPWFRSALIIRKSITVMVTLQPTVTQLHIQPGRRVRVRQRLNYHNNRKSIITTLSPRILPAALLLRIERLCLCCKPKKGKNSTHTRLERATFSLGGRCSTTKLMGRMYNFSVN